MEVTENFNQFTVGNLPTLIYVADFITNIEETQLLNNVAMLSPLLNFSFSLCRLCGLDNITASRS